MNGAALHVLETETAPVEADLCVMPDRVVVFRMAGQRYALPIDRVQEVQQIVAFSTIPSGGVGILGMIDLRGRVVPVVDLRRMVGLPSAPYGLETPMLVCHRAGQLVALIVDEVEDVLGVSEECVQAPPAVHALSSKMIGVARLTDGLVYVLDIDVLLEPVGGGW
jgi:purine-binding chemotaxis protein CheW